MTLLFNFTNDAASTITRKYYIHRQVELEGSEDLNTLCFVYFSIVEVNVYVVCQQKYNVPQM